MCMVRYFYILILFCAAFASQADPSSNLYNKTPKPATGLLEVRYHEVLNDNAYNTLSRYTYRMIHLALSRSGREFKIVPVRKTAFSVPRNIKFVQDGRYDVAWMHTNPDREQALHAIRFPLYRGLGGWRLAFIRENDHRFEGISEEAEIQAMMAGQGEHWPDTDILRSNGYGVHPAYARDNVYQMLKLNRIDYFPRGVFEVWDEMYVAKENGLTLEQDIALVYPTAFYLFVRHNDTYLIKALNEGFEKALDDGSYQALFYETFGGAITKAHLETRRIFTLKNPHLPEDTPLDIPGLWYKPGENRINASK